MSDLAPDTWHGANQRYLAAALAAVRRAVQRYVTPTQDDAEQEQEVAIQNDAFEAERLAMNAPPALETLCATFGLSPFERDVLLLCAGQELEGGLGALYAAAQGNAQHTAPTFSLALAALPHAHWSALAPNAPLRRWRLIELGAGHGLTHSPLHIDERVLHYLVGVQHLDERLVGLVDPVQIEGQLVPSHGALADQIGAMWTRSGRETRLPVIQLSGSDLITKRCIAATACAELGLQLYTLSAQLVPVAPAELEALIRLWEREAALSGSALLLECDDLDHTDTTRTTAVIRCIERMSGVLLVSGRERWPVLQRPAFAFEVASPSASEQRQAWQTALGSAAERLNGQVDTLVGQFNLSAPAIRLAGNEALAQPIEEVSDLQTAVWDACRQAARPQLDELAQRIESAATWDDLILPDAQRQILRDLTAHVRQRWRVYEQWGFGGQGGRGLGISALFAGASGTGKTMAAEVVANTLRLDLYRIDLSAVVSKYIGETEKHLRRIFDAAEMGGAVLLFDEADALFGKRSEIRDSHDRYANIEVSYLLQRMEAYRGLAILTTNLKSALDNAFLRRIRFVVQFPFPDAVQRAEIWRHVFPAATPTEGLQTDKLARLNVAGGNIRNIALNAAFLAADAGEPIRMAHLLRAARSEYAKLEKSLTDAEVAGWIG